MTSNRIRSALIVCLAAAGWACVLFAQTLARAHRVGGIDLTTYLAASRELWRGGNPYALPLPYPYVYPLFLAFVLFPLTWIPEDAALAVWYAVSVLALVWSTREMVRHAFPGLRGDRLTLLLAAVFLVGYPVVQSNLRNGQVNLIVVALCVLAFRATVVADRRVTLGAAALAAAIATKVVPGVLVVYYLHRRRWIFIASTVAVTLALCALPAFVLGGAALAYTRTWAASFVGGSLGGQAGAAPLDFSAGGILVRAFPSLPAFALRVAAAVLVLALAAWADARQNSSERRKSFADACAFSLYLAVVPLVSPKSEIHHLAFAFPAAAIAVAAVWEGMASRSKLATVCLTITGVFFVAGSAIKRYTDPLMFLSLCALAVTMAVVMDGRDQRADA